MNGDPVYLHSFFLIEELWTASELLQITLHNLYTIDLEPVFIFFLFGGCQRVTR